MEIENIYKDFHHTLHRYIQSKIRIKEDAEDILQNVFIQIATKINTLSKKDKLRSWVFTITRNSIIDYYRSKYKNQNTDLNENIEHNLLNEEHGIHLSGLDDCLQAMIRLLPDRYRTIIVDSEIRNIKQKDLALMYGLAYPSLRSRVQRGRDKLKQLFFDCCHVEKDARGSILNIRNKNNGGGDCNTCDL